MKIRFFSFFFGLITQLVLSQEVVCSVADRAAFETKMSQIANLHNPKDFGRTLTAVGKTFLGTPYVAQTLEIGEAEALVVNLQGLDCTTFVENVLAFSLMLKNGVNAFDQFVQNLETIRYKNGQLDGYASRLHYFTEWISDNEKKGLLRDITSDIGGQHAPKIINFMSTHRDLYPFLSDEDNFKKIVAAETDLTGQSICILPQDQIAANEHLLQSGDIIALSTSIKGLDVTHTGILSREDDGRIHLLHASTTGAVEVSKLPLTDYLQKVKSNTGIIVARPL
ncbi:DUF1460 domain-containing protein [Arenibacter sp. GZD96]|uniref:N-acetylmuramoyl-L-alanine amidase-like domain-containing protein n=1 Tax=Aurantibrevibacter litoralis TaxID=3106030 RepID=UPI002AFED30F|nr:N-acetylmuramoyl-L-alanine amidase-like domain-containing protein [Arenibacter sp. GZD-96]MEA1786592.1 DUF1460 domain-containing protein [Arenibacter sp. GZD-96]